MSFQLFLHRWIPARSRRAFVLAVLLFGSIASYFMINHFVFSLVEVDGGSMHPTLRNGGAHVLHRWRYLLGRPQRGDIVAIRDPLDEGLSVKRIIAMPMEEVDFSDGSVRINGEVIPEPYLKKPHWTYPILKTRVNITLGEDEYLVLGDNRTNSIDGRYYGSIDRPRILGVINPR